MTDPDAELTRDTVVMSMEQLATERSVAWQAGYEEGCEDTTDPHARMDSIRSDALGKATLAYGSMADLDPNKVDTYAKYVVTIAHIYLRFLTDDEKPADDYDLAPRDANPHKVEYTGVRINPDGAVMLSRCKADGTWTVWPLGRIMPGEVRVERAAEMVNAMGYDRVGPWSEFSSNGPQLAQVSLRRPAS